MAVKGADVVVHPSGVESNDCGACGVVFACSAGVAVVVVSRGHIGNVMGLSIESEGCKQQKQIHS